MIKKVLTSQGEIPQKYIDYLKSMPAVFFHYYETNTKDFLQWLDDTNLLKVSIPPEEIINLKNSIPDVEMRTVVHRNRMLKQ
jgi:hypothetical protein